MTGILAAAAGLLALDGHASAWCPSSTDYQITCSNCSRELTCDTYGISIEILGNNVTLDGQGYSVYNAPNDGVMVNPSSGSGSGATIKNLNIYDPGWSGIAFYGGVSSTWANVDRVYVSGSPNVGIANSAWSPLEIDTSWTYNNGYGVLGSWASSTAYTDFLNSSAQGNSYGYYAGASPGSWVRNSYFWNNSSVGVDISYTSGMWVDNTSFSGSVGTGLSVYDGDGTSITNNYGNFNGNYDCIVSASDNTWAYNNNWGSYSGSGCIQ